MECINTCDRTKSNVARARWVAVLQNWAPIVQHIVFEVLTVQHVTEGPVRGVAKVENE